MSEQLQEKQRDIPGPTLEDTQDYREMLERLANGGLEFRPRVNAELTSMRIDERRLGTFTSPGGLDPDSKLKLAQQRYIAGLLGFVLGETEVSTSSHTAGCDIRFPEERQLLPLPVRQPDGSFLDENGAPISVIQADMRYSARFLVNNRDKLEQPGAFEASFQRVFDQAEGGQIEVRDKVGDSKGAMSFVRQTARAMGYEVGEFREDAGSGNFVMPVTGTRDGFEEAHAHFPRRKPAS